MRTSRTYVVLGILTLSLVAMGGCGGSSDEPAGAGVPQGMGRGKGGSGGAPPGMGMGMGMRAGGESSVAAAVPVEVSAVLRRDIASFLETNGTLEAENEVDIVARTSGPIVELVAEEGMVVKRDQLLARIDEKETRARVEVARVTLAEAERAHERAKASLESDIISEEVYDQALAKLEATQAQLTNDQIQLGYTRIVAPFNGIIVLRSVKFADNITANQVLFRISDFDPLLCPIQVPERELSRLNLDQPAYLTVESWPEERFSARVLRISPVVDAATGTIKVTLEVGARGKLRPGMFASVYLEMDTHADALVITKSALSLETFGNTVYVVGDNGLAVRRELELGFEEADFVEVVAGLNMADRVIVVGQDGLSDGTPVQILAGPGAGEGRPGSTAQRTGPAPASPEVEEGFRHGGEGAPPPRGKMGGMDFSQMTPEQLEQVKARMRERGMSEEQIEESIRRMRGGRRQP